jgi:hypothetical protein
MALDPIVKRDKYNPSVCPKAPYEGSATWNGHVLGLAIDTGGNWPVLSSNRDLFRVAGVPEPPAKWGDPSWTADAWLRALQKTTRAAADGTPTAIGIIELGTGVFTVDWPGLWKAAWLSPDLKTITCDTPQMVEAAQYFVDLASRDRVMATGAQLQRAFGDGNARTAFWNGQLAMYATSGGGTFAGAQAGQQQGLPLAYAPLPTFKIFGSAQNVGSNGLVTGAKHPEEAWTLIEWSADTPNWAISRGNAPARVDHFAAWSEELYPGDLGSGMRIDVHQASLQNAAPQDPLWKLPTFRQMLSETITPADTKLLAGEAGVGTTLQGLKTAPQPLVPRDLP